ncbi:hypothetical protein P170DRAFT_494323 [Aspergillus steynii IBT 23096]|uniref:alcohol dehydrogenase n=1 Tax=Aspergillus steynii IBT 23096 TaxID=1392250 RepID=A0A2I2G7F6_9EURO|nr:uncharacterized protein P170DRAFT_494323 [Aspergillus steynii IBT 23096]PLB48812.1 hypothetical protein P170DRAFT_494323 [Aspergillus steynii IBT 23096]
MPESIFPKVNGNSLPTTQWAQVSTGKTIELKKTPVPQPGPDEVLVKIEYSGVCHTDLHSWKGDWPVTPKDLCVGGHEGAGLVAALGSRVHNLRIGDAVGIQWLNNTCGTCEYCSVGNQPLCPSLQLSGCTVDGTFQQYCICKADNAVRIPPNIPLETAAPILCAGITVYKAILEANVQPGQTIAIVGGGGGLGSLACQYAKACRYKVLALSSGSSKRNMCLNDLGADVYVDYKSSNVVDEVKSTTNGGPHAAVIVSSVEEPFHQALQYIRPGGTVVAVGLPPGKMSTDIFAMVTQKVNIKGSYVGNRLETEEALNILARARFEVQSRVVDFSELPRVFDMMEKGSMHGRAVLKVGDHLSKYPGRFKSLKGSAGPDDVYQSQDSSPTSFVSPTLQRAIKKAGRDFRSDTVTVPTGPVMQAIVNASTFGDNIYDEGGDSSVNALQEKIVQLTGKEAALFVPSGTMGNQICLRTHLHQPPHTILLDYRAHVQCWETGAIPVLSQATVTGVEPKNGVHLTLDDVKDRIVQEDNFHFPPTRIVSLENTLSGSILPLKDAREISNYVRSVPVPANRTPIAMHLDGARLFDGITAEGIDIKDYLACFDTASLCLSKGIGAPMGSVIVGPKEFIQRAIWFRKMFGGATRQMGMMAAAAEAALDHNLPQLPRVHALARRVAEFFRGIGYELLLPVSTNMIVLDLKKMSIDGEVVAGYCRRHGLAVFPNGRLVFHHQTSEDGVSRLQEALFELIDRH